MVSTSWGASVLSCLPSIAPDCLMPLLTTGPQVTLIILRMRHYYVFGCLLCGQPFLGEEVVPMTTKHAGEGLRYYQCIIVWWCYAYIRSLCTSFYVYESPCTGTPNAWLKKLFNSLLLGQYLIKFSNKETILEFDDFFYLTDLLRSTFKIPGRPCGIFVI